MAYRDSVTTDWQEEAVFSSVCYQTCKREHELTDSDASWHKWWNGQYFNSRVSRSRVKFKVTLGRRVIYILYSFIRQMTDDKTKNI